MPPFASVLLMYNGAKSYQMELSDFFMPNLNHRFILNKIDKTSEDIFSDNVCKRINEINIQKIIQPTECVTDIN